MAAADGPAPVVDTAGLITAVGILAVSAVKGVYDTATTFDWIEYSSQTKAVPKEEAESKDIDIPYLPMKKPVYFPGNPNDFQPINMASYTYNNGKIIKWGYTEKNSYI